MKKEVNKKKLTFTILLCLFFPVGICYFLVWGIKKLIVMADSGSYDDDMESERPRMEFVLAGEPTHDVQSYLAEGVKLHLEYAPGRDMHVVSSGDDYVGFIDRRDVPAYERFSPTSAYIRKVESKDDRIVVTIVVFN